MTQLNCLLLIAALAFLFVRIMNAFETRKWPSEKVTTLSGAIRELILRRNN